jgi:hypothetical protein
VGDTVDTIHAAFALANEAINNGKKNPRIENSSGQKYNCKTIKFR